MDIKRLESPNFGYPKGSQGRNGHKVIAIVNHVSGGSYESNKSWIMNPASNASYHYLVRKNGQIVQFVSDSNAAYANGRVNNPSWSRIKKNVNPNLYTLSIAREGHNHEEPTMQQWESIIELHKEKIRQFDLKVDRDHIIGHSDIDSVDRWYCPGRGFDFDRLIDELKGGSKVKEYVVKRGDTLSEIGAKLGYDWRELAEYNNIENPHLIHPGLVIKLPPKNNNGETERERELLNRIDVLEKENESLKELAIDKFNSVVDLANDSIRIIGGR